MMAKDRPAKILVATDGSPAAGTAVEQEDTKGDPDARYAD
jgi:hypothetical protein